MKNTLSKTDSVGGNVGKHLRLVGRITFEYMYEKNEVEECESTPRT